MEYEDYETGETISREQYIKNGIEHGELLYEYMCGCVIIQDRTADAYIVYCPKHEAAPKLYEALKGLVEYCDTDHPHVWVVARQVLAEAEGKE